MTDPATQTGTFVVTHADDDSALIRNVETAQVHTLASNPALSVHEVLEATIEPEPPLEVTWQVVEIEDRRTIDLVDTDLAPTTDSKERADALEIGEVDRVERAGRGEIHVLAVPPAETETAVGEILEDIETVARGARVGAVRVEVRRVPEDGIVSVRYLPD